MGGDLRDGEDRGEEMNPIGNQMQSMRSKLLLPCVAAMLLLISSQSRAQYKDIVWIERGSGAPVNAVRFSTSQRYVASGDSSGRLDLRDAATGSLVHGIAAHTAPILSVAFPLRDTGRLATSDLDGTIQEWEIADGKRIASYSESGSMNSAVTSIAYAIDSPYLLSGQAFPKSALILWNTATEQIVTTYNGNGGGARGITFAHVDYYAVAGGEEGVVRIWNVARGKLTLALKGHGAAINAVASSATGKYIASASDDHTVRIWEGLDSAGELLWESPSNKPVRVLRGHTDAVTDAAFTPDEKYLVSSSRDGTLKVWNVATGDNVYTYSEHPSPQSSVSVGGDRIASGAADGSVIVWHLRLGEHHLLAAPELLSPDDSAAGQPAGPSLIWSGVTGATSYSVQVATDPTFATEIALDSSGIADTTLSLDRLSPSTLYFWRASAQGDASSSPWSVVRRFTTSGSSSAGESSFEPESGDLLRGILPNPFTSMATIRLFIPSGTSRARLAIYDLLGRPVALLLDAAIPPGEHGISWNASGIAPGLYCCRLEYGSHVETEAMLLR
jgi:WD40 repeat protein